MVLQGYHCRGPELHLWILTRPQLVIVVTSDLANAECIMIDAVTIAGMLYDIATV